MHRLIPLGLCVIVGGGVGCATLQTEVRDPPYVEQLRVRITKVRHAIAETRRTISQSQGAPYLPELYVRLAELLSEEAKYHYRVAYEREQRSTKALHVPQVRLLKEQSITTYRMVLRRFPNTPLGPRILFNIGHEQRELGDYEDMIKTLDDLTVKYPNNSLRHEAMLVLGDYYFDKNELGKSEKYYAGIVNGEMNRVSGLALYKLAWVRVNQGDCKNALLDFERAIDTGRIWAEKERIAREENKEAVAGQDIDVRREALIDLTYCYSRRRKPGRAVQYIRKYAYNRGAYIAALERLASRYGVMNQAIGAIGVGRELLRLAPDNPDRLDDARMLYGAVKRAKQYDHVGDDIRLISMAAIRDAHRPGATAQSREKVLEEFEVYARDLAIRAQKRVRKKRLGPAFKNQVAKGYVALLDAYPEAENRHEMILNLADVQMKLNRYLSAGRRYLEGAALVPEDKVQDRKDALYDSVVALQTFLSKPEDLTHVQRVVARSGIRLAGRRLLKFDLDAERSRQVKFAIAKTLYDEGRYRSAIDQLTAIAYEYPDSEESRASVHMVLDSFRTINDYNGLMDAGHRFLADNSPANAKLKGEIKPIVNAAEQRRLDELSLEAAGDEGRGGLDELESFAERYAGTDLGERALLNAFVAARAAGDSERLYRLGDELEQKYPKSEQLAGILSTLARVATARFEFDRSIDFFYRAAKANPAERVTLLVAAGGLMEELADLEGARKAYEEALRGAKEGARAAPAGAIAALLEKEGKARKTAARLSKLADDGDPEVLARLGLAQILLGDPDSGEMSLANVLASSGSAQSQARAHYGMAEVLNAALEGYVPANDFEAIQEYIALVEVTEQSYLNAARQGDGMMTAASLGRLANMAVHSAARFEKLRVDGLSAEETKQLAQAFQQRADELRAEAVQALAACSDQAWVGSVFNPAVRACLGNTPPKTSELPFDVLKPRKKIDVTGEAAETLRSRVSRNPEDLDGLRDLGSLFLDAGDAHSARLIFARATQTGGGPLELNLLGIASWDAGDVAGALEAFGQAAEGGLEAGRQNLAYGLETLGLGEAAGLVMEKFEKGSEGGRLVNGAGGA